MRAPHRRSRAPFSRSVCAGAIVPGVACSQNPPALAPDPELAAQLKKDQERVTAWEAVAVRSSRCLQVAELEAKVASNPDDPDATQQLLTFLSTQSGQKLIGWNLAWWPPGSARICLADHRTSSGVRNDVVAAQAEPGPGRLGRRRAPCG